MNVDFLLVGEYNESMRILGIDPGIGRLGWGIIEEQGSKIKAISYDCLETSPKLSVADRLVLIYEHLQSLLTEHVPDALAVEELFFNTNATTAFTVGQARGVVLLAAAQHKIPIASYTPLQVKMAVSGYGRAEKNQVGQMVKVLLSLSSVPKPDDTADALAIALTHAFTYKMKR